VRRRDGPDRAPDERSVADAIAGPVTGVDSEAIVRSDDRSRLEAAIRPSTVRCEGRFSGSG
jgi:hypothetical protein